MRRLAGHPTSPGVYAGDANGEHPPGSQRPGQWAGNVKNGSAWAVAQIDAMFVGGLRPKVAIFIASDD
jgi:hypothetical protein